MSTEYKLSYTASEIDEKLGIVDTLEEGVDTIKTDVNNLKQSTIIFYDDAMDGGYPKDTNYLRPIADNPEYVDISYFDREEFLTKETFIASSGEMKVIPFFTFYPIVDTTSNVTMDTGHYVLKSIVCKDFTLYQIFENLSTKDSYIRHVSRNDETNELFMSELLEVSYITQNQGSSNAGKFFTVGDDGNLALIDMPDGIKGEDGISVTESVINSEGQLVIHYSNGTSSNLGRVVGDKGESGKDGADGKSAFAYAQDGGYTGTEESFAVKLAKSIPDVTQEAGESETLVMSQKAVTDLVNDALEKNETIEFEIVDSVDQMVDTTKQYVLSTTNTVWAFTSQQVYVEHNAYDENTATFNARLSSSGELRELGGSLLTDYIEQSYDENCKVTISGINNLVENYSSYFVVDFFDANKNRIGQAHNYYYSTSFKGALPITFNIFKPDASTGGTEITGIENTGFVRIKLGIAVDGTTISAADCNGLIVNFDTKNKNQEESIWYDTGMRPEQTNTNYVDLLVKVNQNTSDIDEMNMRMTSLETEKETLTVPSFWQEAVNECISKIKALQVGRNCITFPFFSDNHQRNGYAGMLIAYIMKKCNIPYCFYGGDSITSGYIENESAMIEEDKAFDSSMSYIPNGRFCRAVGNHDGYWAVSATERHWYSRQQVYELFLREESLAQTKHFGDDGTYYYVDDIASKTRFIVLNFNENDNDGGTSADSVQLQWLKNTALSFNESGWAVVFISHQPVSNHYHALISNATEVREIVGDYMNGTSQNKADVVGWFSGHIHRDRIYSGIAVNETDDTEGEAMPFKQITITSDHTEIAYDDATKHTIANDDQSHAIDFVTINKTTKQVNLTRLGIGNDRSYSY